MIYLGEVQAVNVEEKLLNNGQLDPSQQDQIVYIPQNYYKLKKAIETQGFSLNSV